MAKSLSLAYVKGPRMLFSSSFWLFAVLNIQLFVNWTRAFGLFCLELLLDYAYIIKLMDFIQA